jgi:hypothetical protein
VDFYAVTDSEKVQLDMIAHGRINVLASVAYVEIITDLIIRIR